MPAKWYATSDAAALCAARAQPRANASASTASPLENLVSGLTLKVQEVQPSSDVADSASAGSARPSGVFEYRPVNRALASRMPVDSWARPGSMVSGSVLPIRNTPPLAALPLSLLSPSPPPQAVAARATTTAPTTHLALLAPRMGFLLMSPLIDLRGKKTSPTPLTASIFLPIVCS